MKSSDPYAEAYAKAARAPERCQYHTPTGRQCSPRTRSPSSAPTPNLHPPTPTTSPTCSLGTPKTSRLPRASITPSPHSTNSSPATTSPPAAPLDWPTLPACSSAPFPTSGINTTPSKAGTSRSPPLPGAASDCHLTNTPKPSQDSHRPKTTTRQASRHAHMLPNNFRKFVDRRDVLSLICEV